MPYNFEPLYQNINRNIAAADVLAHIESFLPNRPTSKTIGEKKPDIEILLNNFTRYNKRAMYFAKIFLEHVESEIVRINEWLDKQTKVDEYLMPVSDTIYFNFDAFIICCKSIVDDKILDRAKKLEPTINSQFIAFSDTRFKGIVKTYLRPFRNEVVHLNFNGSSWSSQVHVDKSRKISFTGFRKGNYDKGEDLISAFETILNEMTDIIQTVSRMFIENECLKYGYPIKDVTFRTTTDVVKLSQFVQIKPTI